MIADRETEERNVRRISGELHHSICRMFVPHSTDTDRLLTGGGSATIPAILDQAKKRAAAQVASPAVHYHTLSFFSLSDTMSYGTFCCFQPKRAKTESSESGTADDQSTLVKMEVDASEEVKQVPSTIQPPAAVVVRIPQVQRLRKQCVTCICSPVISSDAALYRCHSRLHEARSTLLSTEMALSLCSKEKQCKLA